MNLRPFYFCFWIAGMASLQILNAQNTIDLPPHLSRYAHFSNYTVTEGLPDEKVLDIFQDHFGILWLATPEGLVRFDGYRFRVFQPVKDDSLTLRNALVTCIAGEPGGDLWIGTAGGLHYFDRKNNVFNLVTARISGEECLSARDYICEVLSGKDSVLWVETGEGELFRYDRKHDTWRIFRHGKPDQLYYHYHALYEDGDHIWIGGRSMGPYRFGKNTGDFTPFPANPDDPSRKRENDVACFYRDSRGYFYVSGLDGFYRMDPSSGIFTKLLPVSTNSITEDNRGRIWLGTGSGVYQYYPDSGVFVQYAHWPSNPSSLINNHVYKVFFDRRGTLWVCTREGLSSLSPEQSRFIRIQHINNDPRTPSSDKITTLFQDRRKNVWIGHYSEGLDCLNTDTFSFVQYSHDPDNPSTLAGNRVSSIFEDSRGILWIGLWTGRGFNRMDPVLKKFTRYSFSPVSLKFDWYTGFAEDQTGKFYVSFWGSMGMSLFDREKGTFGKNFYFDRTDRISSRLTSTLYQDRMGTIWIGTTDNGFSTYNPYTDVVTSWPYKVTQNEEVSPLFVNGFLEDALGRMWIGGEGLYLFSRIDKRVTAVGEQYKIPTGEVRSLSTDRKGRLWAATAKNGLFCIHTENYSYRQYTSDNGLGVFGFSKAVVQLHNGWTILGSNSGLLMFRPDEIPEEEVPPVPVFSGIHLSGQPVEIESLMRRKIKVPPSTDFISLFFASDDYSHPGNIQYEYMVSGLNSTWTPCPAKDPVALINRPAPGSYTLKVRARSEGGQWKEGLDSLTLIVMPEWYQTLLFRGLVLFILLTLLFWWIRSHLQSLHARQKSLELEQKLLRLQMNPHFIYNALFAIQNYIYENNPDQAGRYLSDFAQLIRNILENSRTEFITLEKEIKTLELYLRLQRLRFSGSFSYSVEVDKEIDVSIQKIPPMLAQPFIENAIEHGIRNLPGRSLCIQFTKERKQLKFEVTDDGRGFQPDEISSHENKEAQKHKSLALLITSERLNLLREKYKTRVSLDILNLSDINPGKTGTCVRFSIPINDGV